MALIKCPECGREISDKAPNCPGCGCPSSEFGTVFAEEVRMPSAEIKEPVKKSNVDIFVETVQRIGEENRKNQLHAACELERYLGLGLNECKDILRAWRYGDDIRSIAETFVKEYDDQENDGYVDLENYQYGDNREIDEIIRGTCGKFNDCSGRKVIQTICDKTGLDKKTVKRCIKEMQHPKNFEWASERKRNGGMVIRCPKCRSVDFEVVGTEREFSYKKAYMGRARGEFLGQAEAMAGALQGFQDGDTTFVCKKCGNVWKRKL